MRIFDTTKSYEIYNPDLERGYLKYDTKLIAHHPAEAFIEEKGHYETIRQYPNGGKDVKWVVDVKGQEAKEAYDELEEIQVYVPFTEKELAEKRITELKKFLASTDYQAIKFAEGILSEIEYSPIKYQRIEWRNEINNLQEKFNIYY